MGKALENIDKPNLVPTVKNNDLSKADINTPFKGLEKSFNALASDSGSNSGSESKEENKLKIEGELKSRLENLQFAELDKKFFSKFAEIVISDDPIIKPVIKRFIMDKLRDILLGNIEPARRTSASQQVKEIAENKDTSSEWKAEAQSIYDDSQNPDKTYRIDPITVYPQR